MNEQQEGLLAEFPVDVSREEFVRFNLRMAERRSLMRFRKVYAVAGGLLMLLTLALMVADYVNGRPFDMTLLILLLFVAITVLVLVLGVPNFVRHQTGKFYDKRLLDGNHFYGVLRVYDDRLEKTTCGRTNVMYFAEPVVYLEYEDMMVFFVPRETLLIPARCVTAADAEILRSVSQKIPAARRLLYAKMEGEATERMAPPMADADDEREVSVLLEVRVLYTIEELYQMFSHVILRDYVKWLPLFTGASLIAGVALGFSGGPFLIAGLFVAFFAFFAAVYVWLPRARMRSRMRFMRIPDTEMVYLFTEKGILYSQNGGGDFTLYPWTGLVRAVERTNWVEFQMNSSVFEMPKRCVSDLERLREVVNTYHTPRR